MGNNFSPWTKYSGKAPVRIEVDGPPCIECTQWDPRVIMDGLGNFNGVRLCMAKEMEHDFSCYIPKEKEE